MCSSWVRRVCYCGCAMWVCFHMMCFHMMCFDMGAAIFLFFSFFPFPSLSCCNEFAQQCAICRGTFVTMNMPPMYCNCTSHLSWHAQSRMPFTLSEMHYFVWNMFCTIPLGVPWAAASSLATSSWVNSHPSAPKLSFTCSNDLAPGIGIVPFRMHQLSAT